MWIAGPEPVNVGAGLCDQVNVESPDNRWTMVKKLPVVEEPNLYTERHWSVNWVLPWNKFQYQKLIQG